MLCFPLESERNDAILLFEEDCVGRVIQKRLEVSDLSQEEQIKAANARFSICHTAKACL